MRVKLREEHRLGVFKNRVMTRIFEPKRDEVTGGWRVLHDEELPRLVVNIIMMMMSKRMRQVRNVARIGRSGMSTGL
jgi:hypothetical protein